jgi:Ca2+-dependent lipid-binding protein
MKGKDVGIYYVQLDNFYSEGSQEEKKIMIGRSRKSWLCLTIIEAHLIKDLEFFSKMDPYCQFALTKIDQVVKNWQKTRVQEDIGLKPIWNETFFC